MKGKKGKKPGRGRGKDVVDPNKPKGPKGAYMCFVQVARPKINADNPGLKFADIAKVHLFSYPTWPLSPNPAMTALSPSQTVGTQSTSPC